MDGFGNTSAWAPRALGILRIVVAFLFIQHGTVKLFGVPAMEGMGKVPLMSLFGVAGLLEFVGGALLLLGLGTRPVAFILSGEMAAAYFIGHASQGFLPIINHGELAVTWCFVFLYFFFAGPGAFSLDGKRGKA
jgi:putative oxidoreductase